MLLPAVRLNPSSDSPTEPTSGFPVYTKNITQFNLAMNGNTTAQLILALSEVLKSKTSYMYNMNIFSFIYIYTYISQGVG